jgi:hypothetical protein
MSRRCIIEIQMDNDAFAGDLAMEELYRIVRNVSEHVSLYRADDSIDLKLRDVNGNKVGYCKVDPAAEEDGDNV